MPSLEEDDDFSLEPLDMVESEEKLIAEQETISLEAIENKIEVLDKISEDSFDELKDLLGSVKQEKTIVEESKVDNLTK